MDAPEIVKLEQRIAQLKARLGRKKARLNAEQRKLDTRRKILTGAYVIARRPELLRELDFKTFIAQKDQYLFPDLFPSSTVPASAPLRNIREAEPIKIGAKPTKIGA